MICSGIPGTSEEGSSVYQLITTGATSYSVGNSSTVTTLGCSLDLNSLTQNCTVLYNKNIV